MPTASASERSSAGDTRLYLTAFQNDYISVVEPVSGRALHQIAVEADQAGMAVSPDGRRLYVVDGVPATQGRLRVFDTATWDVIHREPAPHRLRLLGGNPITLSPDGRWLVVQFFDLDRRFSWERVFDAGNLRFLPDGAWPLTDCNLDPPRLVGHLDDDGVYVQCQEFVAAMAAEDLAPRWRAPSPAPFQRDRFGWPEVGRAALVASPVGQRLYGMYPLTERITAGQRVPPIRTDLAMLVWEAETGLLVQDVKLSEQVSVPVATAGRGDAAYLVFSRDGDRLLAIWENMLWVLDRERVGVEDPQHRRSRALSAAHHHGKLVPVAARRHVQRGPRHHGPYAPRC